MGRLESSSAYQGLHERLLEQVRHTSRRGSGSLLGWAAATGGRQIGLERW